MELPSTERESMLFVATAIVSLCVNVIFVCKWMLGGICSSPVDIDTEDAAQLHSTAEEGEWQSSRKRSLMTMTDFDRIAIECNQEAMTHDRRILTEQLVLLAKYDINDTEVVAPDNLMEMRKHKNNGLNGDLESGAAFVVDTRTKNGGGGRSIVKKKVAAKAKKATAARKELIQSLSRGQQRYQQKIILLDKIKALQMFIPKKRLFQAARAEPRKYNRLSVTKSNLLAAAASNHQMMIWKQTKQNTEASYRKDMQQLDSTKYQCSRTEIVLPTASS